MSTRRDAGNFAAEIDAHLALETDRLAAEGLSIEEAQLEARRRFGSIMAAKERFHEAHRLLWLDHLGQDLRQGARSLKRYPVACTVAVISLALGVGATTAMLTVRDALFRKPPPLYRAPAQLSRVQVGSPEQPLRPSSGVPGALCAEWLQTRIIGAALAAATPSRVHDYRTDDRTDTIGVRAATSNFFAVLGVEAAVGTTALTRTTVVLSDRAWGRVFDYRADVVGRAIWIDDKPLVVAGVMPERFWFSSTDSAVWTLLDADALAREATVEVVARRTRDVRPAGLSAQLQNGLTAYAGRLIPRERELRLAVSGIEGTPLGRAVSLALPWVLSVAVLLTLLIACANVAILVIAQWTVREHEIAIRASLGATRGRIVRALVAESVVIAAAGGALGTAVSLGLIANVANRAGVGARFFDFSVEPHVLATAIAVTLLAGIVSGIGPALLETRRLHENPMRTLTTSDRVRQRWRHALVVMEVAVTVALLVVTGAMLGAYQRQLSRDLGFDPHQLIAMRVENSAGVPVSRVIDAVGRMPGVAAISPASAVPHMGFGPLEPVAVTPAGDGAVRAERLSIGPAFFATLGVALRAGRAFTSADAPDTHTAIVNERLAAKLFPGENAVGRAIWLEGANYDVVGVVAQYLDAALQGADRDPKVFLPLPVSAQGAPRMTFLIRAPADAAAVKRPLRREVRDAAAGNVVANLYTLDEVITVGGQELLVGTAPLVPLIATGLLLTAAGIYGVQAFAVARRSKELALRIAIGAGRRDIVRLVTIHSLRSLAAGTTIGVGATFALSRVVRASGGGGSFLDPGWPAFLVPVAIIAVVGLAATLVPSHRALRIEAAVLLRTT